MNSRSKSTACLVEKTPTDSFDFENGFSSHPGELNSVSHTRTKFCRHKHGKVRAPLAKRGFSLSRFFQRSSKTFDSPLEDEREAFDESHSPSQPLTLGHIYSSSSTNLKESDSWTSLLDERSRQAPTQQSCKIPSANEIRTGKPNTLRTNSEQVFNRENPTGALSTVDSVCLQKSCANASADEVKNITTSEPAMLRRRLALRRRLLSRSRQPLDESAGHQLRNHEINIKSQGLEFGGFQASLLGGRRHSFYVKTLAGETYIFAAASQDERDCWLTWYASYPEECS
ncbi:unnamed protein product [Hydatigera taeniaeformis]|uniref:PH domain-containing protein n=1 Tax=Hydatigena taeniaeformis TaxID=6205 RepID=A0A3P7FNA1_HYDTA|nr:unnamed protein product [Hydatigera taeniaeformis]